MPAQAQQGPVDADVLRAELDRLRHEHALALAEERNARALAGAFACVPEPTHAPHASRTGQQPHPWGDP